MNNKALKYTFALVLISMIVAVVLFFPRKENVISPLDYNFNNPVWVSSFNRFEPIFTEPFESLHLEFWDGESLTISSRDVDRIRISPIELYDYLKSRNKKIGDISVVVHNHLTLNRFSEGNRRFYNWIRNNAEFMGWYVVYYPGTKHAVCLIAGRVQEKK